MKISYQWLRDFVETDLKPRELAERLTNAGLAVDAVHETAGDDFVLEFDLTSNRPDCLSHLGIAREVATLERKELKTPNLRASNVAGSAKDLAAVEILDEKLCPRYAARVVCGVKIAPSPAWLQECLQAIGLRPINNVADITNYVMFELGQPLHAFDLGKLTEKRIIVRRAKAGEKIKTLDGNEYELSDEMLVIADAARPVAVAGVMGGEESAVYEETRDVLIESAYFDASSVRRTSKKLNLSSDSSYRFERGVDYEGVRRAQDRAVALICELAGGAATEDAIDVYPRKIASPEVALRFARVAQLTGVEVAREEQTRILRALGFEKTSSDDEARAAFKVPTWRVDVSLEEDLVEEVARIAGYDKIKSELPPSNVAGAYRAGETRRRVAARALAAAGYDEAISFSFIDSTHDREFELLPGLIEREMRERMSSDREIGEHALSSSAGKNATNDVDENNQSPFVTLTNPIIEGAARMRPTLLAGLLDAVRRNFNHGVRDVRLFEMGRVFARQNGAANGNDSARPREIESLALVATGADTMRGAASVGRDLDFYDLKGALDAAVRAMNLPELGYAPHDEAKHLRAGQSAQVSLEGTKIGALGRLSDELAAVYKFRQPVFVAEINLGALLAAPEEPPRYAPLPRFPSVVRDVSVLAPRRVTFDEMRRAALALELPECRAVEFVDVYEGANLPEGFRSVTLRVEYRADERTLRDEEVDAMHAKIVEELERACGAKLRA